jgi:hypothetical protein
VKNIVSILVIMLFLQPQISNSVVWLNFFLHQETIASELCVERKTQENTCRGSYQFAEQRVETPWLESGA